MRPARRGRVGRLRSGRLHGGRVRATAFMTDSQVYWREILARLDRSRKGRAASDARVGAATYTVADDELARLGLDGRLLAELRRCRGRGFDHRMEQLARAKLIRIGPYDADCCDHDVDVLLARELGRAVLAAAFGPANRAVLERYWDAIHEWGVDPFPMYELLHVLTAGDPPGRGRPGSHA